MFGALDRTWIVAEIGVNHEGDEAIAADLIRKAAAAGADAVKFQTYRPDTFVSATQPERRDVVAGRMLPDGAMQRLADIAAEAGVTFFSTPLGLPDVDLLDPVCPLFKIASGEITWAALLEKVAGTGKPMIVSTGGALGPEIGRAVDIILTIRPDIIEKGELVLMHCVSAYPTPPEEANLANIPMLAERFGALIGYSDHTLGIKACELAVGYGAVVLEKHFTYRKEDQAFRDHALSADPDDMAALVDAVRQAERYRGIGERRLQPSEEAVLPAMRRGLHAAADLAAGTVLEAGHLTGLRPLVGIPVEQIDRVIGRTLAHDIADGMLVSDKDLL
ncbi:MAG: N-acetylneuraminate synthase family protein [Alphaproteobacteria bacterium]